MPNQLDFSFLGRGSTYQDSSNSTSLMDNFAKGLSIQEQRERLKQERMQTEQMDMALRRAKTTEELMKSSPDVTADVTIRDLAAVNPEVASVLQGIKGAQQAQSLRASGEEREITKANLDNLETSQRMYENGMQGARAARTAKMVDADNHIIGYADAASAALAEDDPGRAVSSFVSSINDMVATGKIDKSNADQIIRNLGSKGRGEIKAELTRLTELGVGAKNRVALNESMQRATDRASKPAYDKPFTAPVASKEDAALTARIIKDDPEFKTLSVSAKNSAAMSLSQAALSLTALKNYLGDPTTYNDALSAVRQVATRYNKGGTLSGFFGQNEFDSVGFQSEITKLMQPLYEQAKSGDVFRPVKSQEGVEVSKNRNQVLGSDDVPPAIMEREKAKGRSEDSIRKAWQAYKKERK